MRSDLKSVTLPFPANLMATAQSPLALPPSYARELKNMLLGPDGSGTKRNGFVPVGSLLGEEIVALFSYPYSGQTQLLAVSNAGKIYRQNDAAWVLLKSGLNPLGMPQGVMFAGRLVLCNGFDAVMQYDGVNVVEVETRVTDAGSGLTRVSDSQFSINSDAAFYSAGSTVALTIGGTEVLAVVASATQAGAVTTVNLTTAAMATAPTAVKFTVRPPAFGGLAVAHNRLWGFGAGGFGPTLKTGVDAMRVYYTQNVNSVNGWPDPNTGIIPSLNLADKASVADELLAMRVVDGMTVFFGRQHLQLYEGTNPGVVGGSAPDFAWLKSIPVGLAHPRALHNLPNDVLMLSPLGARTLSRTLATEQLDLADVGRALDPTVQAKLATLNTPEAFRSMQAFTCMAQQWFGFGFAGESLIWQLNPAGGGWTMFDGLYASISAACNAPDGALFIAKAGQVYRYDFATWDDAGQTFIARWWAPWVAPAGKGRWANKYIEILLVPQTQQPAILKRFSGLDEENPRIMPIVIAGKADYWDDTHWDTGFFDNGAGHENLTRDHSVAEHFSFALESETALPLRALGLRVYGITE